MLVGLREFRLDPVLAGGGWVSSLVRPCQRVARAYAGWEYAIFGRLLRGQVIYIPP